MPNASLNNDNQLSISKLNWVAFRGFEDNGIELSSEFNFIQGSNGAGKTSLLEACYILARARSFKTNHWNRVAKDKQPHFSIRGHITNNNQRFLLASKWVDQTLNLAVNDEKIERRENLSDYIIVQYIGANLHAIIENGPKVRRLWLDRAMFHVKQSYAVSWKKYQRALIQRNKLLTQQANVALLVPWTDILVTEGLFINEQRQLYIESLKPFFETVVQNLLGMNCVLELKNGWLNDTSLAHSIERNYQRDQKNGYTQYGPHRADLKFSLPNGKQMEQISRGQQKLIGISLLVAESMLLDKLSVPAIRLVDEIGADLDQDKKKLVYQSLIQSSHQTIMVGTDWVDDDYNCKSKMFHVKHGVFETCASL